MACCIGIALVIALLRRATGRGGESATAGSFAPTAVRYAPGDARGARTPSPPPAVRTARQRAGARPATAGTSIRFGLGVGLLAHLLLVAALVQVGAFTSASMTTVDVALRLAAFAAPAGLLLLGDRHQRVDLSPGLVAMAAGLALGAASLADMHLLGAFDLERGALAADVLFHLTGPLLAGLGAAALHLGRIPSSALERS